MPQKKILVIDDDPTAVEGIKEVLKTYDYAIYTAGNADDGIKKAQEVLPDLVILDILMPQKDGYTTLREIRNIPEIKDIPVIMLTIKKEEHMRDLFVVERISGYIEKGFEGEHLVDNIKSALK